MPRAPKMPLPESIATGRFEVTGKISFFLVNPQLYDEFERGQRALEEWQKELREFLDSLPPPEPRDPS